MIPGNDDAIRAVKLIVSKMADAVIEAKQGEVLEGAMAVSYTHLQQYLTQHFADVIENHFVGIVVMQ